MKIALLSDIHSNIFALEAVYKDLNDEKVDVILISGDIIGYYYWPKEVIELLSNDDRVFCVKGNHEKILEKTRNSDIEASFYRNKYGSGYDTCCEQLSDKHINWIFNLPDELYLTFNEITFFISHGSLNSIDDYIYPNATLSDLEDNYSTSDITVFGHTHYPFLHTHNGKILINPGSVGQPRDIGGLASYVVINTENFVTRFKRIRFDYSNLVETAKNKDKDLEYLWKIMYR